MMSITAKVSESQYNDFVEIGKKFGCSNAFQFANFIVAKIISAEMTMVADNAKLQLAFQQSQATINALNEELGKAKTTLPEQCYKKGYSDAEQNFAKKAGATALKAEFYDLHIANRTGGCGLTGTCLFVKNDVKTQIQYIKTISDYERANKG